VVEESRISTGKGETVTTRWFRREKRERENMVVESRVG